MDELLTWRDHVSYIHKSLLRYFGIFNHLKCFVDRKIIRKLYFAFIFSRINYGIEVYGCCADNQLKRIQVIQSSLLKVILRKERKYSTDQLHSELRRLKVEDIYKMQCLKMYYKIENNICSRYTLSLSLYVTRIFTNTTPEDATMFDRQLSSQRG